MRKKILASLLCALAILTNGIVVNAEENETGSGTVVEYGSYEEVAESIQSESGDKIYLCSVEEVGDVFRAVYQDAELQQSSDGATISPRIVVSVEKEVIRSYSTFEQIPYTISYEEYNSQYNTWMKGTLYLKKAEQLATSWTAYYRGSLAGNI